MVGSPYGDPAFYFTADRTPPRGGAEARPVADDGRGRPGDPGRRWRADGYTQSLHECRNTVIMYKSKICMTDTTRQSQSQREEDGFRSKRKATSFKAQLYTGLSTATFFGVLGLVVTTGVKTLGAGVAAAEAAALFANPSPWPRSGARSSPGWRAPGWPRSSGRKCGCWRTSTWPTATPNA